MTDALIEVSASSNFLDDLLGDLVPNPSQLPTQDELFVHHFCGGKIPRVQNLIVWLRQQLSIYDRFAYYDLYISRKFTLKGYERVDLRSVAKVLIEHYLMANYAHWFQAGEIGRTAADMDKVTDLLLSKENLRSVIFVENRS